MVTAWRDRLGRLGQWSWIAGWCWLLWLVVRPWNELGGVVSERLRWCEHAACGLGLIVGYTAGDLARLGDGHCGRRGHRARWLLYPALTVALLAVAWLRGSGRDDAIGVAFTGWLAYTAGASTGLLGYGRAQEAGDGNQLPESVDGASSVAYTSIARPTNSGMKPTR